ncbi:MAG: hypothetical protein UW64_C0003G0066 [Microgenomates group bacterium GW2011_GWC1_44_37]|uniref:Uncharacterized protein n=1 Tax=Candidatus Collierbacteria bacterium GW2011_GWB2_44_22 TaxID=1618387 RepID=A0A0G1I114_9BACT|nr:MAG: hypothetical protein UW31_C0005G0065 [Candidatus Collierbacteria bacterium GW2011_GWA2_44_13]KKT50942.1 MAG: hypothetical protein UW42_C0012G0005 [Candidatus Collierbacteria bacterium GW2011_GWB1_44_197]KKT52513.1 MAG: hypothetical protein UW44_C0001G0065 [Candidatus Collierbacteria bacterium GW2011_GWB2_44_22]KKT62736.1 MAG: hypothetical protein UW56_C0004G0049 [Candidatus Collierbacteria bacterium GW2011_GWD1_44_27]KKT66513.1 MAG: hypothetical protein UW58_C0007G0033 [Candidatus Colli
MKKTNTDKTPYLILLIFTIFIIGIIYLVLPSPAFPDLSNSAQSDEPGDTWQNPDQKGFFTNMERNRVLTDIQSKFVIKFGGVTLPSFRLNYRPEEAYEMVRDQLQSYYLEEIIYPFRESIFVNGWEPTKSPKTSGLPAMSRPDISLHGVTYNAKITLRPVGSAVWARLLIWTLIFPSSYFVYLSLKKSMSSLA